MFTNIPEELQSTSQWIGWRRRQRGDKDTKEPVNPHTGLLASIKNPGIWGTFEDAIDAVDQGRARGIGFVMTESDEFSGVDLDSALNPQTGEIASWAQEIISKLNSYTEVSPSSTGIHIWVKGKLPPGNRNKFNVAGSTGRVEIYSRDRFLTVTGTHLEGTPRRVESRAVELTALFSRLFGENPADLDNGPHGSLVIDLRIEPSVADRLMAEKILGEHPDILETWKADQSNGDIAFAKEAARLIGPDLPGIFRLMRASPLFQSEDRQYKLLRGLRGQTCYATATIREAVAAVEAERDGQRETSQLYEPRIGAGRSKSSTPPTILSIREITEVVLPSPKWSVHDILPEGLALLAGKPKTGKSWLALEIALAVTGGTQALGHLHVMQGETLFLALEDSRLRLQGRIKKLQESHGTRQAGLEFATEWPRLDRGGLEHFDRWLSEHPEARLVVIDTLAKIRPPRTPRGDVYAEDYAALSGLKGLSDRYHVTILVIHHLRKMASEDPLDTISGTLGLPGAADTLLVLMRQRGQDDARLFATGRDIDEQELALKWERQSATWTVMGKAGEYFVSQARREILQVLKEANEPLSPLVVANLLGKNHSTIKNLLVRMRKDGLVASDAKGRYSVKELGVIQPYAVTEENTKPVYPIDHVDSVGSVDSVDQDRAVAG